MCIYVFDTFCNILLKDKLACFLVENGEQCAMQWGKYSLLKISARLCLVIFKKLATTIAQPTFIYAMKETAVC